MPGLGGGYTKFPTKTLRRIPNHVTYRAKLEAKWRRKGYIVVFA